MSFHFVNNKGMYFVYLDHVFSTRLGQCHLIIGVKYICNNFNMKRRGQLVIGRTLRATKGRQKERSENER